MHKRMKASRTILKAIERFRMRKWPRRFKYADRHLAVQMKARVRQEMETAAMERQKNLERAKSMGILPSRAAAMEAERAATAPLPSPKESSSEDSTEETRTEAEEESFVSSHFEPGYKQVPGKAVRELLTDDERLTLLTTFNPSVFGGARVEHQQRWTEPWKPITFEKESPQRDLQDEATVPSVQSFSTVSVVQHDGFPSGRSRAESPLVRQRPSSASMKREYSATSTKSRPRSASGLRSGKRGPSVATKSAMPAARRPPLARPRSAAALRR